MLFKYRYGLVVKFPLAMRKPWVRFPVPVKLIIYYNIYLLYNGSKNKEKNKK